MRRRSLAILLGSSAAVLAAAATPVTWAYSASADTPAYQARSHWFTQTEPLKDQIVFLRNGSTPASAGKTQIAVRVTTRQHAAMSCFVESRDGDDLGRFHTIAAGSTAPVVLANSVPAGTQYNLICSGTTTKNPQVLEGAITETAQ